MIEAILPADVAVVEAREDRLDGELFPIERSSLGQALEKRRREFVTARACARDALALLGLPPAAIATGERGEPLWPSGIVGSITHCAGYRACALARVGEAVGLGIDAEPNAPLPTGVLEVVARDEEYPMVAELACGQPAIHWDRLLFCCKEAIYKAWFPLTCHGLNFADATVEMDPERNTFQAQLQVSPDRVPQDVTMPLTGRWLNCDGLLLTAIALARWTAGHRDKFD